MLIYILEYKTLSLSKEEVTEPVLPRTLGYTWIIDFFTCNVVQSSFLSSPQTSTVQYGSHFWFLST